MRSKIVAKRYALYYIIIILVVLKDSRYPTYIDWIKLFEYIYEGTSNPPTPVTGYEGMTV